MTRLDLRAFGRSGTTGEQVSECVAAGWSGFAGRVLDRQPLSIPWGSVTGQRLAVRLTYLGRPFANIPLEIVTRRSPQVEHINVVRLDPVGLPSPDPIPCLALPYQVAEQLHACTDPRDGERHNDRVSDLMDLILIQDLSPDLDLGVTKRACLEVFAERSTHPWPPVVAPSPQSERLWNALITDTDFTIANLRDAAHRVNALITAIDDSP